VWDNPNELVVGNSGEIYVAPVGTAEPANESSALNSALFGLGYLDEDGVTFSVDPSVTDFGAWQSRSPVRRELTAQAVSLTFKLEQWNEETLRLAFGGGAVTTVSSGHYKYTLPAGGDALDERMMIADVVDGSEKFRFVLPRGNVSETVSVDFRRSALGVLAVTFRALAPSADPNGAPAYVLSNSSAFAAGS
jgi:hypothetical protein